MTRLYLGQVNKKCVAGLKIIEGAPGAELAATQRRLITPPLPSYGVPAPPVRATALTLTRLRQPTTLPRLIVAGRIDLFSGDAAEDPTLIESGIGANVWSGEVRAGSGYSLGFNAPIGYFNLDQALTERLR